MLQAQKRLSLVALLGLLSTSVYAVPFNGFYIGAAGGGSQGGFNIHQSVQVAPSVGSNELLNIVQTNNHHETDNSALGDLNFGLGHTFNQVLYLGIEGDVAFQDLSVSSTASIQNYNINSPLTISAQTKAKISDQLSLALIPGIVLQQNTLLYGKVGPAWADIKTRGSASYNHAIFAPVVLSGSNQFSDNGYQTGLLLALGIEHYVAQNVSIKLEYDHVNYGTIHNNNTISSGINSNDPDNFPISGSITDNDKVTASTNSVMFGVAYHIA